MCAKRDFQRLLRARLLSPLHPFRACNRTQPAPHHSFCSSGCPPILFHCLLFFIFIFSTSPFFPLQSLFLLPTFSFSTKHHHPHRHVLSDQRPLSLFWPRSKRSLPYPYFPAPPSLPYALLSIALRCRPHVPPTSPVGNWRAGCTCKPARLYGHTTVSQP